MLLEEWNRSNSEEKEEKIEIKCLSYSYLLYFDKFIWFNTFHAIYRNPINPKANLREIYGWISYFIDNPIKLISIVILITADIFNWNTIKWQSYLDKLKIAINVTKARATFFFLFFCGWRQTMVVETTRYYCISSK